MTADTAVNRGELTPVQLAQVIMAKLSVLDVTVEGLAAFLGIDPDSPVDPEDAIPRVLLLHRDEDERVKAFAALQEQHKSRVIFGTLSYSHATADAVAQIVGEISTKAQILTAEQEGPQGQCCRYRPCGTTRGWLVQSHGDYDAE